MKNTIKLVIKYLFYGISWGCTFLVMFCLAFYIMGAKDIFSQILDNFINQAIGAIIVGIACGSTAIIYEFERLSYMVKTLIHFIIGMGVFYPVALYLHWIPFYPERILYTATQFLLSCGLFMLIWLCFYFYHRKEAKEINDRLRELERNEPD